MAGVSGPAASLPEDLLVEILARVPYRSLCRFRCVSPSWRALCSDPGLLKRSPQTLSGFFWADRLRDGLRETRLLNFPGGSSGQRPLVDPSLPFLRRGGYTHGFALVDCCGGLLLCECFTSPSSPPDVDYVVCNPATEKWTVLPRTEELHGPQKYSNNVRLGFDPANPSRFAVFVFLQDFYGVTIGLEVYSSETGTWTSEQIEWSEGTSVDNYQGLVSVFLNGTLHLTTGFSVVTLDMDSKIWREIPAPYIYYYPRRVGQSQRRLHVMQIDHYSDDGCLLSVWVLDDYASGDWTLKHTANISELLGRHVHVRRGEELYPLIAIHPDCDLIFFIDRLEKRLMSYDMDSQKVQVVYNEGEYYCEPYHPYTPCFAEWLSDSN